MYYSAVVYLCCLTVINMTAHIFISLCSLCQNINKANLDYDMAELRVGQVCQSEVSPADERRSFTVGEGETKRQKCEGT